MIQILDDALSHLEKRVEELGADAQALSLRDDDITLSQSFDSSRIREVSASHTRN